MTPFDFAGQPIAPEPVLRALGYRDSSPSDEILAMVDRSLAEASDLPGIRGGYTVKSITGWSERGVETECGRIESGRLAAISSPSAKLAFGMVTAGTVVDDKTSQAVDMVEACVWDAVGTVICENAVDQLLSVIAGDTGQILSMPFSPGYCDWALDGQAVIFNAIDPSLLDIAYFPDSLMMTPQKSVSFVACMSNAPMERNPCRLCHLKNCFMRRA